MSLVIDEGLTDDIVLQRDASNCASVVVRGSLRQDVQGHILVSVFRREVPLVGWDSRPVGTATGRNWTASLVDLPTGGPYVVRFQVADHPEISTTVRSVLVGDLWILGGQSNMEGLGDLVDVEPPSPYVHVFDMGGRWHIAEEPLHWLCDSPDSVHCSQTGDAKLVAMRVARQQRTKGAGLGLAFANAYYAATGVPVGLIPCAHGGSYMIEWDPERRREGGGSLYGSLLRHVRQAGGKVRGMLWYQGESDTNPNDVRLFRERFKNLVASVRDDFNDPHLLFYTMQIGRFVWHDAPSPVSWNAIQDLQRLLPDEIPHTAVVPAIDLEMDDPIHIGTQGLRRLGRRLARVAVPAVRGEKGPTPGIRLQSVTLEGQEQKRVRVSYTGVAEPGFALSQPVIGFSLHDADGKAINIIFKAMVDPKNPSDILLYLTPPDTHNNVPEPEGLFLHYGYGFSPVCTLVDSQDMSAPVFGPVLLRNKPLD